MDIHWDYGAPGFSEEGDEELAAIYRAMTCGADGLYHEAPDEPIQTNTQKETRRVEKARPTRRQAARNHDQYQPRGQR